MNIVSSSRKILPHLRPFAGLILLAVAAFAAAMPLGNTGAAPEAIRLKIGSGYPVANNAWVRGAQEIFRPTVDRILARRGRYRIEWTQIYGPSFRGLGNVADAVREGVVDLGLIIYPYEETRFFPHNFTFYAPFATCDQVLVQRIAAEMHHRFPRLRTIAEERLGQRWLGVMASSCYGMIARFPWRGFRELKGRAIGAGAQHILWLPGAGLDGVLAGITRARASLESGRYDALVASLDAVRRYSLAEPARHWIETGFGAVAPYALTMNLPRFRSLPREVQDAIVEAGRAWGSGSTALDQELAEAIARRLREQGVQLHEVPLQERIEWMNAMSNVPNDWAQEAIRRGYLFGPDLMRAYIGELEAAGAKQLRRWRID
ncbi:MAG: hypothetical protein HYZ11_00285 [Candidatus Tectomicrobia bacterium]|uniref:C4-dicarboxylate ABC transporter substrate-binding protein n=1 Tax=Tectimicrobiota bacterium TaxID=2528274 RepID=A0A932MKZ0_UNCTE|nr:hypothetical protein [Candidatus Tectomicrobia bacterium]